MNAFLDERVLGKMSQRAILPDIIKDQKIMILQYTIARLFRGEEAKLPVSPDLFINSNDMPSGLSEREKVVYNHFMTTKLSLSLRMLLSECDDSYFSKLALYLFSKQHRMSEELTDTLERYGVNGGSYLA